MIKGIETSNLPEYTFDAYTGVFLSCKWATIPLTFVDKSQDSNLNPLIEYLLEINSFRNYQIQTCKPVNGYTRAIQFVCPDSQKTIFKLLYGGRSQNETICILMTGQETNEAYPIIAKHFNMKTTRVDSAVNYYEKYHDMNKLIKKIAKTEPHHVGNNLSGHTYYFGSRTSPTMIRHYQYGLCHYPDLKYTHNLNRIEVEYKPKDKTHQFEVQNLTAEQVFARSKLGADIQQYIFRKTANSYKMASVNRDRNLTNIQTVTHMFITYEKAIMQFISDNGGDLESLGIFGIKTIEHHNNWKKSG